MKKRFVLYVFVICLFAVLLSSCGNRDTLVLNSKYFDELEAKEPDIEWIRNAGISNKTNRYNGPRFEINDVDGELCLEDCKAEDVHITHLIHYYFIGTDIGEFGGGIMCANYDGQHNDEPPEIILQENCRGFLHPSFEYPEGYVGKSETECYAFTGIAHLLLDEGKIHKIKLTEDGYGIEEFAVLGSTPDAFAMDGNEIIVATRKSLVSVDENGKITELLTLDYWEDLGVNSIVIHNDSYYMGCASGILKYVRETKEVVWYPYYNVE